MSVEQILAWADAHHEEYGRWPAQSSGRVAESPKHTWRGIDMTLKLGGRGLSGGSSLIRLLGEHRGRKGRTGPDELSVEQILSWADAYHEKHGRWPNGASGRVAAAPSENWNNISQMLRVGGRSLPGGSSLDRVLAEHRGVRNRTSLPDLSIDQILAWADAHHAAMASWPTSYAGPVQGAPGETWSKIDGALKRGARGLPGGSALGRLLDECRPWGRLSLEQRTKLVWRTTPVIAADPDFVTQPGAIAGAQGQGGRDIDGTG